MHVSPYSSNEMGDRDEFGTVVYARTDDGLDSLRVPLTDCLDVVAPIVGIDDIPPGLVSAMIDQLDDSEATGKSGDDLLVEIDRYGRDRGFGKVLDIVESPFSAAEHLVMPASGDPEIEALIDSAVSHDVRVTVVPGPWFDGDGSGSMGSVLSRRAGVGEEWSGRPPLGFRVKNGHLVKAPNYSDVVGTLRLVQRDKLSKRSAADELDTSRRTINRCLDHPDRYGLE